MARPAGLEPAAFCLEAAGGILPNLARGSATGVLSASWGNSLQVALSFISSHFTRFCSIFLIDPLRITQRIGAIVWGYSDCRSNSTGSMKTEFQEKHPEAAYQLQLDLAYNDAQKLNPRMVEIDL